MDKPRRLYSIYHKQGRRWLRISPAALPLNRARQYFQSILLLGGCELRHARKGSDFDNEAEYNANFHAAFPPTIKETSNDR